MKKKIIIGCMLALMASPAIQAAEGWPSNYNGVMLQGFYWNSYEETSWSKLTAQSDELSGSFNLIWVPNSAYTGPAKSMGYNPKYWFSQISSFGYESQLRTMISTFKNKGTGIIEDVVINHKNGLTNWCDFVNESWTDTKGTTHAVNWSLADICANDDGGNTKAQGYNITGANDTGDDFSGYRDLDHTSSNVQANCETYLDYLLQDLGYAGFRYDMVKGYAPMYTKLYNEHANPTYSVGEYWDGSQSAVSKWIENTDRTSAAFDYPLKYIINSAFGSSNWNMLAYGGIATGDLKRYAVTFIDNHDTYLLANDKLATNVLPANAYILALPGTPCIFWPHWTSYKSELKQMIAARKAVGINNESIIAEQHAYANGYLMKVNGTQGSVLFVAGSLDGYDTTGYTLVSSGSNYAYYTSTSQAPIVDNKTSTLDIYVQSTTAPYLYAWDSNGKEMLASWPGELLTEQVERNGNTWYHKAVPMNAAASSLNIIFNNGSGSQTKDIKGLTSTSFFTYNGGSTYTDVTATGIQSVNANTTMTAQPVYSLNGMYMGTTTTKTKKGIYLIGGKKTMVQ